VENGGRKALAELVRGTCIFDVIPQPLQEFYSDVYDLAHYESRILTFNYHCSSPEHARLFQMQVLPQKDGGLAIVNSVLVEHAHNVPGVFPSATDYEDPRGLITMCSHCRRTRRISHHETWDWVPAYLSRLPLTVSHGLCGVCRNYFYQSDAGTSRRQTVPSIEGELF